MPTLNALGKPLTVPFAGVPVYVIELKASSLQKFVFEILKLTDGAVLTLTIDVATLVQPCAEVPITEYVVLVLGLMAMLGALTPLLHV